MPPLLLAAAVGVLASLGAAARAVHLQQPGVAGGLVLFGLFGALALWMLAERRLPAAAGLGVLALVDGLLLARSSPLPVVFVGCGLIAAVSAANGRSLLPGLPARTPPVAGLSLGLVLAAQFSWYRLHLGVAGVLLVASLVLGEVARHRPRWGAAADRVIASIVLVVVRVIGLVVVFVAAAITLYLPGLLLRAWGVLTRRSTRPVGWVRHGSTVAEARRDQLLPFASPARRVRWRRYATGFVLLLLLLPATLIGRAWRNSAPHDAAAGPGIVFPDFAYPDEPWVDRLHEAGFDVQYHPSLGWKNADVESPDLQVRDGIRRSWTAEEEPVLEVWFVGGSALWGLGQRDFETIPSEIAKRAAEAGIPIKAVNLGVPGYAQWQEDADVGYRLSRGERPDLIVAYDGANDLTAMLYRASEGITPLDEPPNRFHEDIERGTRYAPEDRGEPASETALLAAFRSSYGAGVDLLERTAGAYDVPTAFYFQPQYLSTKPDPEVDGPVLEATPWMKPPSGDGERNIIRQVRTQLPDQVVDLSEALDDAGAVTWFDPVHTNELGADLVADALWTTLQPRLEELRDAG